MTSIKHTTTLKAECAARIADAVSAGRQFHSRHMDIAKRTNEHVSDKLPQYAREYLRGYRDAKLEALWRETTFCYLVQDQSTGAFVWTPATDLVYAGECRIDDGSCAHSGHYVAFRNPPAAHVWHKSDGSLLLDLTGEPRFFTDPKPTRE